MSTLYTKYRARKLRIDYANVFKLPGERTLDSYVDWMPKTDGCPHILLALTNLKAKKEGLQLQQRKGIMCIDEMVVRHDVWYAE